LNYIHSVFVVKILQATAKILFVDEKAKYIVIFAFKKIMKATVID